MKTLIELSILLILFLLICYIIELGIMMNSMRNKCFWWNVILTLTLTEPSNLFYIFAHLHTKWLSIHINSPFKSAHIPQNNVNFTLHAWNSFNSTGVIKTHQPQQVLLRTKQTTRISFSFRYASTKFHGKLNHSQQQIDITEHRLTSLTPLTLIAGIQPLKLNFVIVGF